MRKRRINLDAIKKIPIVQVAQCLNINLRKIGGGVWAERDPEQEGGVSSLRIFEDSNRFKRFSGKEQGGVSAGSTIDFVMHVKECDFKEAISYLASSFPNFL